MCNKLVELKSVHLPLMDLLDVYLLFSLYVQLTSQPRHIHLPNPIKDKEIGTVYVYDCQSFLSLRIFSSVKKSFWNESLCKEYQH